MSKNTHHKLPASRGGKTNRHNCCKAYKKRHAFWHALFGNMTGEEIMEDWNENWLDPRFKIVRR